MANAVHHLSGLCAVAALACSCGGTDATPRPPRPIAGEQPGVLDSARRCGEPGPTRTALPRALVDGMRRVGTATIAAGETKRVGGVEAHYDPSAWIGTMEVGHRGPSLALLIDRAEVGEHDPYGGQQDLSPGRAFQTFVGPYRIDGQASPEDPPRTVRVAVERRPCPDHTVTGPSARPVWMWLSTEAIALHTVDLQGQLLQVALQARGDGPHVEVSALGWRHGMVPEPGTVRSFRIDDRLVTIEQVVPGRGTRFDGAWRSTGPAHLSVLVRVAPAPPVPHEAAAVAPTTACGAPAPSRTTLPAELLHAPAQRGPAIMLAAGDRREVEGLALDVGTDELPPDPRPGRDEPRRFVRLSSPAPLTPSTVTFGAFGSSTQLVRAEHTLLHVEPAGAGTPPPRLQVRAFPLACARTVPPLELAGDATYVWLSTVGQAIFVVGTSERPRLSLQVHADPNHPSFSATTENAGDSGNLASSLVGHVASLDGYRIEIVDVAADAATHATTWGWTADSGVPAVHVQFRVSRE